MTNGVFWTIGGQALLFVYTILAGVCIGFFFDCFRILRKTVPFMAKSTSIVALEDLFFWLVATFGMFYFMLHSNFGEIRLFAIVGAICGGAVYFATLSRLIMLVLISSIEFLKKIIIKIFGFFFAPFRLLHVLAAPPIRKAKSKVCSVLRLTLRHVKIRLTRSIRDWFILRKKV